MEKSRESTDAANIRSEYAEIMVSILEDPNTAINSGHVVQLQQKQADWQNAEVATNLNSLAKTGDANTGDLTVTITGTPAADGTATLTYTVGTSTAAPTLNINFD